MAPLIPLERTFRDPYQLNAELILTSEQHQMASPATNGRTLKMSTLSQIIMGLKKPLLVEEIRMEKTNGFIPKSSQGLQQPHERS